ncbi:hypothetical protein PT2222_130161 [Paraburkholderia tropica]
MVYKTIQLGKNKKDYEMEGF